MQTVLLRGSDFDPVIASHAIRFHERLLGRWSLTALDATLIDTRTVHSFGLKESIGVVGIDEHLTVVDTAFESEEVAQPNGMTTIELTCIEIEHCPICDIALEWRTREI